jgi:hypothetical protein
MINPIRQLISKSYEYISPENLFTIKRGNLLNTRDDVLELYDRRRFFIREFRTHLTGMATLIEEIEFCNQQLKRILKEADGK